jgi:hypothetical protein
VLVASAGHAESAAAGFAASGLPPDSIRFGYRPLYRQPIFTQYAATCPNAEATCAATLQLPVHPGLPEAALEWTAVCIRAAEVSGVQWVPVADIAGLQAPSELPALADAAARWAKARD